MSELKLNMLYATNADFREYVDKCTKTYRKSIDEVLDLATTAEYALYLQNKGEGKIDGGNTVQK